MSRYYREKEIDEEINSYISDQQKQGNNPKPEYAVCVNDNHFIAVDHLLFQCSSEYADIAKHFGGTMNVEYHSGVTVTEVVPVLDDEYRELIKLLDAVDTDKDEREVGQELVILLNQKGILCEYQNQGIDIKFRVVQPIDYTKYSQPKGCELKKKFPSNIRGMYSDFAKILKYLKQENFLSCLLLNVRSGEYFRISKFYLGKPIEESVNISGKVRYAIGEICDHCYFHIFIEDGRSFGCSYLKCPAYKLRDFSSENLKLNIKWIGNRLLLQPLDNDFPKNKFLDIDESKWVLLDSENHIIKEEGD